MKHSGLLYLARRRPVADFGPDGEFRLTLSLVDNLGHGRVEGYCVRWSGPQAKAFWAAQQGALVPGAVLSVELERLQLCMVGGRNGLPELRARALRLEVVPKTARGVHSPVESARASGCFVGPEGDGCALSPAEVAVAARGGR